MSDDKNNTRLYLGQSSAVSEQDATIIGNNESYQRGLRAINTLNRMPGIDAVVEQLSKIIASHLVTDATGHMGSKRNRPAYHMIFEGNPGTGKTTVARLMGDIFYGAEILDQGHVVEAKGSDLLGEYIGHTGPKVKKLIEDAKGGVLFIDEAYSLTSDRGHDFRDDAITELVALMEQGREDFIVILAGYPDDLKDLLKTNPGLKSRIPYTVNFKDYNRIELEKILRSMATERGMRFQKGVVANIVDYLEAQKLNPEISFANGREIRNIIQYMYDNASMDVFGGFSGINTLRKMMAVAAGEEDLPDISNLVITQQNLDVYLQQNSKGVTREKMGFDLSPKNI